MLVAVMVAVAPMALALDLMAPGISGDYIEARSCDVWTGPCFANGEMGLTGREAMLVWTVRDGAWDGVDLSGLSVMAAVAVDKTLGNLKYHPRSGKAVIIVDEKASPVQHDALVDFTVAMSEGLIKDVTGVVTSPMEVTVGQCKVGGCSSAKAGELAELRTRCMKDGDQICRNEGTFYPPLIKVDDAYPAFAGTNRFDAEGLNVKWDMEGKRSAFIAKFAH
jgi:hypothetical protein